METIKTEKNIKSRLPRPSKKFKMVKKVIQTIFPIVSNCTLKSIQLQELKAEHQPLSDPIEILSYTDIDQQDNTDDDDLHGDCVIPSEEILLDSKTDDYQNTDNEIELHDDRNYDVTDVEMYEQEMPYEQSDLQTGQTQQQPHTRPQHSIRHFQSCLNSSADRLRHDKELVDFQKQLMQKEFDEVRAMRQEKHKLEMQILSAELKHKFIEHQKQLEFLNKRILQDI